MTPTVYIGRFFGDARQSLGVLTYSDGVELFVCKTLELGWHDNANDVSCIPTGRYPCKWTRSNRLSKVAGHDVFTYEVLNVKDRAGIRIHSANYFYQLKGCIAFGDAYKDINVDGELDVVHSGATVGQFNAKMATRDFTLEIT